MKRFVRIICWSLIAIFFQVSFLLFLNNYYWKSQSTFKIVPVSEVKAEEPKMLTNLEVPTESGDLKVSYNGKHIAYILKGKLVVQDTYTGKSQSIDIPNKGSISYYRWLPDRDRLIIAEKYVNGRKETIKFTYYDESTGERTEIVDNHKELAQIVLSETDYEVKDMSLSTATSVMFIRISKAGGKNIIYHMNIMSQLEKLESNNIQMVSMEALSTEDKLIYDTPVYKKLMAAPSNKQISITGVKQYILLGVDDDDNIYVGNGEDGKIKSIYYGTLGTPTKDWKNIQLEQPTEKKNIFITRKGKILLNDNLKGEINNLTDNKATKYIGKFLAIYNKGVISEENGKLTDNCFKD